MAGRAYALEAGAMTVLAEASGLALPERLRPTSLSLQEGELVCLIGPNGSGKTSLLHALAGIGSPEGEVRIDGREPRGLHPHQRQRLLTFLPASRDIKWPLIARDLIALGLPPGTGNAAVAQLIQDLELNGLLDRRVDQLSTGERSRILIARALAAEPKLLLLDEPTANLDPLWQLKLLDYLKRNAAAHGQTVLMAVHDLEIARRYADRLIIMSGGEAKARGDPEALLAGVHMQDVFGIEWAGGCWTPAISPPADRRSSP
jgi:iron complex transport system ATP-binding protein